MNDHPSVEIVGTSAPATGLRHLAGHVVAARAHGEDAAHDVQCAAHGRDIGVRSEVPRPIALQAARDEDARIRLVQRDLDVRVRLVVPKHDVVLRAVLLDEVLFQDERTGFVRHHNRFDIGNLIHQPSCLGRLQVLGTEIASHARAQSLRLPDVEDHSRGVLPEIDAGALWEVRNLSRDWVRRDGHDPLQSSG